MKLFFDTETSDKVDFKMPEDWSGQGRLVQLWMILATEEGEEASYAKILVKPNGFLISPQAQAVHGISTEHALKYGVDVRAALGLFWHLARASTLTVAFNHEFDRMIMKGEFLRAKAASSNFNFDCPTDKLPSLCEMEAMTEICALAPKFRGAGPKWPNLQEAHRRAYGVEFIGAHDSMADVRALFAIHKWRLAQSGATR